MSTCPGERELRQYLESGTPENSRDNPASQPETNALAEHLTLCAACRARLEALCKEAAEDVGGLLRHLHVRGRVDSAALPPAPPVGNPQTTVAESSVLGDAGPPDANPHSLTRDVLQPRFLKQAEGESDLIIKPKSDAMPLPGELGDRYQLFGEIARGGMGAVLRGRDMDLGREIAVKVLLEKHAHRKEIVGRFVEEAQIGGQLQHPGIVPVYDIGRFGGKPFFTMKLVKGETLASLLAARPDPSADFPRFVTIMLQVAQTVAYAHAKGVIHRDLKPANVMVGAFGEVQVMDWGLAKILAEGGIADEERASRAQRVSEDVTTIRTPRSTGSPGNHGSDTEPGSILGTPAYMPPEQASGDIANLDRRADVFGLGAIL